MGQLLYILLYVIYVGLFLRLISRWQFFNIPDVKKTHLAFFFLLKVVAGFGLTLIYTYYYTDQSKADIYRYFSDSKIISSVLFTNPIAWLKIMSGVGTFDPGTFKYLNDTWHFTHPAADFITSNSFLIRIIVVLNYLSCYNIYIDTLLLNSITFIALVQLYKALLPYFIGFPQILYWPLFLMPSFVFWSSGLLKEGLILVGISLYLSTWFNISNKPAWKSVALLLAGLMVVMLTKIYVAGTLIICSLFLPLKFTMDYRLVWLTRISFWVVVVFGTWYALHHGFCERIIDKRNEFVALSIAQNSGSLIDGSLKQADCGTLISLVPVAIVNAVLRPFVWHPDNLFEMLFAVENLVFLFALIALLVFYFKKPQKQKLLLALFCFFFALLNYLGIGITVPIVGAIVHYRVVAAPFLLLSVLLMTDLAKLKQLLQKATFFN